MPDWESVRQELTGKNVTKHLLWEEYTQQYPNSSYSYSQYCHHLGVWLAKQKRSMRQIHKAGETLFVDYAGQTIPIVNGTTGEVRHAQVFVAVMGASNYTYGAPNLRRQSKKMLSKLEHIWNAIRATKEETNWLPTPCY